MYIDIFSISKFHETTITYFHYFFPLYSIFNITYLQRGINIELIGNHSYDAHSAPSKIYKCLKYYMVKSINSYIIKSCYFCANNM